MLKKTFHIDYKHWLVVGMILFFILLSAYILLVAFYPEKVFDYYRGEDETSIWVNIKPFGVHKEISKTSTYKAPDLQWSPDKKHLAFYDMTREKIYDKEWSLDVVDTRTFKKKTIFIGTYRTSFYKWISDKIIRVYVGAGSGVRIYRDININIPEPFIAVEHETSEYWVPEKTF